MNRLNDSSKRSKSKSANDGENKPRRAKRRPPITIGGIKFVGDAVWVSELSSIVFVGVLLAALLYISQIMLRNEIAIHEFDERIALLKSEQLSMSHEMEIMRERQRVIILLNAEAGRKIKRETIVKLADIIHTSSTQFGYKPELLLAVMAVESRFDPGALGRYRSGSLSGAVGIMQIKYETAREVAKTLGIETLTRQELMEPEMNMILGTAYLTQLISRFKSFELGIMAYNLGPGTVRRTLSRREKLPMQYYEKVITHYFRLKSLGDELVRLDALADIANR